MVNARSRTVKTNKGMRLILFVAGMVGAVVATLNNILWGGLARTFKFLWTKGRTGKTLGVCFALLLGLGTLTLFRAAMIVDGPEDYETLMTMLRLMAEWVLAIELGMNVHMSAIVIIVGSAVLTYALLHAFTATKPSSNRELPKEVQVR